MWTTNGRRGRSTESGGCQAGVQNALRICLEKNVRPGCDRVHAIPTLVSLGRRVPFMPFMPFVALVPFLTLATGCGDGLRSVTGVVMVDGQPAMEGVQVLFTPQGNTRMAAGAVGANGGFTMKTMVSPGVMRGEYKVVLINSTASIPPPESAPATGASGVGTAPPIGWDAYVNSVQKFLDNPPKGKGWIPKFYAEVGKTPLVWSVPKDGSKATFEISSESTPASQGKTQ